MTWNLRQVSRPKNISKEFKFPKHREVCENRIESFQMKCEQTAITLDREHEAATGNPWHCNMDGWCGQVL
ncbi:hypothetical protein ccbrp13_25880 [Ktedonobacteria bacterium brp13]|nr:hypothetical protein ccbrp13_25880 [Ktedonobacteria bacterium brp13]